MPSIVLRTWYLVLLMLLLGCTKQERVYVPDNEAPPDRSVSTLKVETYVNKCYIGLLARKPTEAEMQAGVKMLRDSSLSSGGRKQMLANILSQEEFLVNTYLTDGTLLLNNWDTTLFAFFRDQFIELRLDTANVVYYGIIDTGIIGLQRLLNIPQDLASGAIDIRAMHMRMVNNYAYDEINMGSENFVRSVFDHFLLRYPTTSELAEGIKMVDGFEGIAFLQTGESRNDFVNIFFHTDAYNEGQVRWAFQRYLYRNATTEELSYYTRLYRQTGSRENLLTELLSINEYAGF